MLIFNGMTNVEVSTPQVIVEAIMHAIRERGITALKEPSTRARLDLCDAPARDQINVRIERLMAEGRISELKHA